MTTNNGKVKTKMVFKKENFDGMVHTVLYNGVSPYGGKTEEEYLAEGYTVMTDDEFSEFWNEYEKSLCNDWSEITEEQYNDALNVLPPKKWSNGGFYIGECYTGSLYGFYQEFGGKYYTSLQSIFTPRAEILDSLEKFIEEREETA